MDRGAGGESQPVDRVFRHLGEQPQGANGHLDDDVVDAGIGVNGGHAAGQHVVQAQPLGRTRVARITARAGIRTRTVVPVGTRLSDAEQLAAVERQRAWIP